MKDKDFAKVYERNYKRSFLFAKSYVHDDLVAEDIAAESLFKYWQICKESEENVSEPAVGITAPIIRTHILQTFDGCVDNPLRFFSLTVIDQTQRMDRHGV